MPRRHERSFSAVTCIAGRPAPSVHVDAGSSASTGRRPTLVALRFARLGGLRDRVRGRATAAADVRAGAPHVLVPLLRPPGHDLAPAPPRRDRPGACRAVDVGGEDAAAARCQRLHRLRARVPARLARAHLPLRLRVRTSSARSSRPTAAAGTTTPPTTSTTTRSGAFPAGTATASCSRPGTNSRPSPGGSLGTS